MAQKIVMLTLGDERRAQMIVGAFSERTGLESNEIPGGVEFPLTEDDHSVQVVQTLNDIDEQWPEHIALGDPEG